MEKLENQQAKPTIPLPQIMRIPAVLLTDKQIQELPPHQRKQYLKAIARIK